MNEEVNVERLSEAGPRWLWRDRQPGPLVSAVLQSNMEEIWRKANADGQELPEPLLTVKAAATFANVCEESIRRAYRANQLRVQPFGWHGVRIHPTDLFDWLGRGAKTRPERIN